VVGGVFAPNSLEALQRLGIEGALCDVRHRGSLFKLIEGSDVVVNATNSVPMDPARERFIQEVEESASNVARVCRELGVANLLSFGSLLRARPESQGSFDEDSGVVSVREEGELRELAGKKTRLIQLRLGNVYCGDSPGEFSLPFFLPGTQVMSSKLFKVSFLSFFCLFFSDLLSSCVGVARTKGCGHRGWRQLAAAVACRCKKKSTLLGFAQTFCYTDDAASVAVSVVEEMANNEFPVTAASFARLYHVCDDAGATQVFLSFV
jgi:hypothetical protein